MGLGTHAFTDVKEDRSKPQCIPESRKELLGALYS